MQKKTRAGYIVAIFLFTLFLALLTHSFWLPFLPQQITFIKGVVAFIEEHSGFLEGSAVIAGAILLVWNALRNRLLPPSITIEGEFLQSVTIKELRESLGKWGGQVKWVDREILTVEDLRRKKRVALKGTMKLGKTREAIELISKAIESDLILDRNVFLPSYFIGQNSVVSMQHLLEEKLYNKTSALIFIDDLSHHFNGEILDDLGDIIEIAEKICSNLFVVITIRTDQWNKQHRNWLRTHGVTQYKVGFFNKSQIELLLENALELFKIDAEPEAKQILINKNDRTPEHILSVLRQLNVNQVNRLTVMIATSQMGYETKMIWFNNRRQIARENEIASEIIQVL